MTLLAAVQKLQVHAASAGAQEAPLTPTETNLAFPFSVCYLGTSEIMAESAGMEKDLPVLFLDLHVARADLPIDVKVLMAFYEAFKPLLIADPTLGGAVDTILMTRTDPIRATLGAMKYGSVDTLGLRYQIKVKQKSTVP